MLEALEMTASILKQDRLDITVALAGAAECQFTRLLNKADQSLEEARPAVALAVPVDIQT